MMSACSGVSDTPVAIESPATIETPFPTTPATSSETPSAPSATAATPTPEATPADFDLTASLPVRAGERHQTTGSVPHIQTDAQPDPSVDAELRRRAFLLPGVQNLQSGVSLPGARGLILSEELELAHPETLPSGREFGHIHPDGSLHLWLPIERAIEVDRAKWGELHPWVDRDGFWDGVVMVYTPETLEELEITIQIMVAAYNFATGDDLKPSDIA